MFPLLCEIDFLFVYSDLLFTAELSDFLEWENRIHPAFFESLRLLSYSLLNLLFTVTFGLSVIGVLSYYMKNKHERNALTGKERRIYTICVVLAIYSFLQIGPETAEKIMPISVTWEAMYLTYVIRLFTYVLSPLLYLQIVNTVDLLGQRAESRQQITDEIPI
ncbi:hypothetical protein M3Y97_00647600 [Aphelenchoides bicaudatus]|nr:hypothetical protein M3Y97_00647600 [Aphelenchoides bicaudatus]